jgi:hypothetical protein
MSKTASRKSPQRPSLKTELAEAKVRIHRLENDLKVALHILQHWQDKYTQARGLPTPSTGTLEVILVEEELMEQSKLLADMSSELAWSALTGE